MQNNNRKILINANKNQMSIPKNHINKFNLITNKKSLIIKNNQSIESTKKSAVDNENVEMKSPLKLESNSQILNNNKRNFAKFSNESIVDKSKFNSIKHKVEEIYKKFNDESISSKSLNKVNYNIGKPSIIKEINDWRSNFAQMLEKEKNSVSINSDFLPATHNYMGSMIIKLFKFWVLYIEMNFKLISLDFDRLLIIIREAILIVTDNESLKIYFTNFMKRMNRKNLNENLSKFLNKDVSFIEKNFDLSLNYIFEDINKNKTKTPDRKRIVEFSTKLSLINSNTKKNPLDMVESKLNFKEEVGEDLKNDVAKKEENVKKIDFEKESEIIEKIFSNISNLETNDDSKLKNIINIDDIITIKHEGENRDLICSKEIDLKSNINQKNENSLEIVRQNIKNKIEPKKEFSEKREIQSERNNNLKDASQKNDDVTHHTPQKTENNSIKKSQIKTNLKIDRDLQKVDDDKQKIEHIFPLEYTLIFDLSSQKSDKNELNKSVSNSSELLIRIKDDEIPLTNNIFSNKTYKDNKPFFNDSYSSFNLQNHSLIREFNTTSFKESSCCEYHNFTSQKKFLQKDKDEITNSSFVLEKDEDAKSNSFLRIRRKRSKIMGLYENEFPKNYNGESLISQDSYYETYKSFMVTRNSLNKQS